jgi:hypothetical protein
MATLGDLAKLVRSKNAGPFWLTIDIMFDDANAYYRARDSEIVNRAAIARLYNRNPADIIVVNHDTALAIKVSFPRPQSSGSAHDSDVYGGAIRAAAGAGSAGLTGLVIASRQAVPAISQGAGATR